MKQIIKNYNNFVNKTIFKVKNKTNNNFRISSFNRALITLITLLFFYVFYLLIPILYDKSSIQKNIEIKLLDEFRVNISTSYDISYRILPTPHFLIKDSKILINDTKKLKSIAEVKNLRVFISQKNLFDKDKMKIKKLTIDNANFSLLRKDFKLLNKLSEIKWSTNKIQISKSNLFFKNDLNELITIIKINKALLFFDNQEQLNFFKLKGEAFKIPFVLNQNNKIDNLEKNQIKIKAKSLKLNIFNKSQKNDSFINGTNVTSMIKTTLTTNYSVKNDIITFNSNDDINRFSYDGNLSINPFDLDLNINLENYKSSKILNINPILIDFFKTGIFFNNNISLNTTVTANSNARGEIFNNLKINLNIHNGIINFNESKFINNKIGSLEIYNSNLFSENDKLFLNADIKIDIQNSKNLFSFLQTSKNSRKEINDILINLNYELLTNEIKFNNIKINEKKISDELTAVIEDFDFSGFKNLNQSKRLLNELIALYEG